MQWRAAASRLLARAHCGRTECLRRSQECFLVAYNLDGTPLRAVASTGTQSQALPRPRLRVYLSAPAYPCAPLNALS